MPIAYLDVPYGLVADAKKRIAALMNDALAEAYPFPDDHRIFLREWPLDSVSQNGSLASEPARPVLSIYAPQGVDLDAKRKMLKRINAAVRDAYELPDFMIFIQEYPLELVAHEGNLLADNQQRVEEQANAYA